MRVYIYEVNEPPPMIRKINTPGWLIDNTSSDWVEKPAWAPSRIHGLLGASWKQHVQDNNGQGPYNPLVVAECLRPGLWRVWIIETGE